MKKFTFPCIMLAALWCFSVAPNHADPGIRPKPRPGADANRIQPIASENQHAPNSSIQPTPTDEVTLRLNLKPGQIYKTCYRSTKNSCFCFNGGNQAGGNTSGSQIDYYLALFVENVDATGNIKMKITCDSIVADSAVWHRFNVRNITSYTSDSAVAALYARYDRLNQYLATMRGKSFGLHLSPRAEILEVKGWEKFTAAPDTLPESDRVLVEAEKYQVELLDVFLATWVVLPAQPVKLGDQWRNTQILPTHLPWRSRTAGPLDTASVTQKTHLNQLAGNHVELISRYIRPKQGHGTRIAWHSATEKIPLNLDGGAITVDKNSGMPVEVDLLLTDGPELMDCLGCGGFGRHDEITIRPYGTWLDKLIQQTN